MEANSDIPKNNNRKTLKDFVPLVFAFFGGLVILSIYQNLRLYFSGVLDSFLNKSFLLFVLNHTGFTALTALVLAFLFNFLENRKPNSGFKVVRIIFLIVLGVEGLLIAYYVQNYEILGVGVYGISNSENIRFFLPPIVFMLLATGLIFHYIHKATATSYRVISRMYPFTIVLFSLFLATLNADKKPINENKTQHLMGSIITNLFDFNTYEGKDEFPLLKPYKLDNSLAPYFNLGITKPNIVFVIVEGLSSDFVGKNARFKGFTPNLDTLATQSLYWKNYLSNTGTSFASLPMIMGSLPFGENGFTNIEKFTHRNTLYSILKSNGYTTTFNYGGNSALNHLDKFLDEEKVDLILDKNSFGAHFQLQEEDAAGNSLGYPDKELFKQWHTQSFTPNDPRLDVFLTLSTKNPYFAPNIEKLESQVEQKLVKLPLSKRAKRLIRKNKEIFASLLYADDALNMFIKNYKKRDEFKNTIFIITGSHSLTDLPQNNDLGRYQVPFMIYSPLLKSPGTINTLASHADIAPSIISLLDSHYRFDVPKQVAWLGSGLVSNTVFNPSKQIPLFRDLNNIQDFIQGQYYLSGDSDYILDENLSVSDNEDNDAIAVVQKSFKYFKSVNSYVTAINKLIPESESLLAIPNPNFSKTEIIWVESVFNGKDIDNAYFTARDLAFDKDWERALLLCKYILSQTPRHADTEILMGRIYSWQKDYNTSETVLKEAVRKYPKYADAYSALLDTYFWASTNEKGAIIFEAVKRNGVHTKDLEQKIIRAKEHILKKSALLNNTNESDVVQIDLLDNE